LQKFSKQIIFLFIISHTPKFDLGYFAAKLCNSIIVGIPIHTIKSLIASKAASLFENTMFRGA